MAGVITKEMTGAGIRPMRMMGDRDLAIVIGRFTFDSDYATGGESLAASDLDMQELLFVVPTKMFSGGTATRGAIYDAVWNPSTSKMVAVGASANAATETQFEVAAHTDLSSLIVRFLAVGYL